MDHLVIFYDDKSTFIIEGRLMQFGPLEDTYAVALEITGTSVVGGHKLRPGVVVVVQPTAVVVNVQTSSVVYNGRDWYAEMPADMQRYFDEHPEWPGVLGLNALQRPFGAQRRGSKQGTN